MRPSFLHSYIMIDQLDETNFLLYAARNYINDQCYDTVEFYEDLNRFKYLKRLFKRYVEVGDLKERLILNHIVVLYNVFESTALTRMLFFRLYEFKSELKPFLVLIGRMPERVDKIGLTGNTVISSDIHMDDTVVDILRNI